MTNQHSNCPKCGANLPANSPAGICPKCLLQAGMPSEGQPQKASDPFAATIERTKGFSLPDSSDLSSHFPDLEIGELLGQGGMGAVYCALQTRLDRKVALKIIRPDAASDRSFAERFNREARTLARLNHPNIVAVYDFGEVTLAGEGGDSQRLYYFLMEYVDGANLRQLLQAGELPAVRALTIVPQICDALQFAHDEGVIHRDIKPENILVDRRGRVKIADFGLAKLLSDEKTDYTLTGTHQVMGTPRYMAPEQMEGAHSVDHRADIYSLGVVFYEMLTGELPLGRFDPPSMRSSVDQQWDQVVLRTLEKEPQRRYQKASEIRTDVERISELDLAPDALNPGYVPNETENRSLEKPPSTTPNYGMLTLGGTMASLGMMMLLLALFTSAHDVFVWIGMGIALGGGGCCAIAFANDARLPHGTPPNYGMLVLGSMMGLVGFAMLMAIPFAGNGYGLANYHPGNVFVWVGIGLFLGGGGCCAIGWEAEREKSGE